MHHVIHFECYYVFVQKICKLGVGLRFKKKPHTWLHITHVIQIGLPHLWHLTSPRENMNRL